MTRKYLLIGISTAALAAGVASAQTGNTSTTSGCQTDTSTSTNTCTVNNNAVNNDRNQSTIRISGTNNVVTVDQLGDDNRSFVDITGNTNTVDHDQAGDENFASTTINGSNNRSDIEQRDENSSATVSITGNRNTSSVLQGASTGDAGGGASLASGGQNNVATILLRGNNLSSSVTQGGTNATGATGGDNSATVDLSSAVATVTTAGVATQSSTITQSSRGNTARVVIREGATSADDFNSSAITQNNTLFSGGSTTGTFTSGAPTATNNPRSDNVADNSIAGVGNRVVVNQDGVQNFSSASVSRGGTGATSGTPAAFNGLAVPANRRAGNDVTVTQSGRNLSSQIAVGGREAAQGRGNQLALTQRGTSTGATTDASGTTTGGVATTTAGEEGRNHSATVYQFGQLGRIDITQENNTASTAVTTSNTAGVQSGSVADVSQSSFAGTVTLRQSGTNTAFLSQGGGAADTGSNTSGNNVLTVSQIDAGDLASTSTGSTDPFGGTGTTTPGETRSNIVLASQAGRFNTATVNQNASNASASVFQRRGSTNATVLINQGTGAGFGSVAAPSATAVGASANLTADVEQGGRGTIDIRQDGGSLRARVNQNNSDFSGAGNETGATPSVAQISQISVFNSALVNQTGSSNSATVDQRSSGTSALVNRVTITQAGGSVNGANTATARQISAATALQSGTTAGSGVSGGTAAVAAGPSGDPDARAAGARSAEIVISQTNNATATSSNNGPNSATVEQRGAGQYGEITQNGRNNTAGILQEAGATNAVAIIRQTGFGNAFFITQTAPGQFFRVTQDGSGNNVVTSSGTGGGGTGNTTPIPVGVGGFTATP